MEVSCKYQVNTSQEAIAFLSDSPLVVPALRLQLGRRYFIKEWIRPSIVELFNCPLEKFTDVQLSHIPLPLLAHILRVRSQVDFYRRSIITSTCVLDHHTNCEWREDCQQAWNIVLNEIIRGLLHPTSPRSADTIMVALSSSYIDGLNVQCRTKAVDELAETRGLYKPEDILYQGIEDAVAMCTPAVLV